MSAGMFFFKMADSTMKIFPFLIRFIRSGMVWHFFLVCAEFKPHWTAIRLLWAEPHHRFVQDWISSSRLASAIYSCCIFKVWSPQICCFCRQFLHSCCVRVARLYIRPHELLQRLAGVTKTEAVSPDRKLHYAKVTPREILCPGVNHSARGRLCKHIGPSVFSELGGCLFCC